MDNKYLEVVGIAFFKNKSLLISKSHNCKQNNLYTLVGGKIEKGETVLQAAVRECKEEIGNSFDITENDLTEVLCFLEKAASNPNLTIHIHILISKKEIDMLPSTSEEIIDYRWFSLKDNPDILCASIKNHLLEYAITNFLL